MEGMAGGDAAFLFTFHERFGPKITWIVRDMVRGMGRLDILRDDDEIDGLVIDACEVIYSRASGWRADGARPWKWARAAIRSRVAAGIGHRPVSFEEAYDHGLPVGDAAGADGEVSGLLARDADLTGDDIVDLIQVDPRARLLDRAIRSVGCERSQQICWQYGVQKALGDPSPAVTVARMFGVEPGNVRQIFVRQKAKVVALIESDDRFEPLRQFGWFAA